MSVLPLARTESVTIVQSRDAAFFVVTGTTTGFGGSLEIQRSDAKIHPPLFYVFEVPGNTGINPNAPPVEQTVTVAVSFPGRYAEAFVETAEGRRRVQSITLRETAHDAGPAAAQVADAPARIDPLPGEIGGWAWLNVQPKSDHALHVLLRQMMPSPGYKLQLTKAAPQGFNPRVLLLELEVKKPDGPVALVLTPSEATFDEIPSAVSYDTVHIKQLGLLINVQQIR